MLFLKLGAPFKSIHRFFRAPSSSISIGRQEHAAFLVHLQICAFTVTVAVHCVLKSFEVLLGHFQFLYQTGGGTVNMSKGQRTYTQALMQVGIFFEDGHLDEFHGILRVAALWLLLLLLLLLLSHGSRQTVKGGFYGLASLAPFGVESYDHNGIMFVGYQCFEGCQADGFVHKGWFVWIDGTFGGALFCGTTLLPVPFQSNAPHSVSKATFYLVVR